MGHQKPNTDRSGPADPRALTAFNEHRSLLFSIAYRMVGSVADAEDVLQDAFIRWQNFSQSVEDFAVGFMVASTCQTAPPLVTCSGSPESAPPNLVQCLVR